MIIWYGVAQRFDVIVEALHRCVGCLHGLSKCLFVDHAKCLRQVCVIVRRAAVRGRDQLVHDVEIFRGHFARCQRRIVGAVGIGLLGNGEFGFAKLTPHGDALGGKLVGDDDHAGLLLRKWFKLIYEGVFLRG